MSGSATIAFTIDPDSLAWLGELRERLKILADLVKLVDRIRYGSGTVQLQMRATSGAGEQRIVFQFDQPWLDLMAALRTLDRDGDLIAHSGHLDSPSLVGAAMVKEPSGANPDGDGICNEAQP